MRVTHSPVSMPVSQNRPLPVVTPVRSPIAQERQEILASERADTSVATPSSAALSFEINSGSKSMTVTLSDQTSGEVVRKIVYDYGGRQRAVPKTRGHLIDLSG